DPNAVARLWAELNRETGGLLDPIRDEAAHARALDAFERLMGLVTADPDSPLAGLYALLAERLQAFERRGAVPRAEGREILRFLLEQHSLRQAGLPEVGSQGVVSELLAGRRAFTARSARLPALSSARGGSRPAAPAAWQWLARS
ncbi:MAG TPA: hypothetical protein VHN99_12305, partial [Deinococcales bacterium]|nr:hypothetical protein [Deinococcales bacterium]